MKTTNRHNLKHLSAFTAALLLLAANATATEIQIPPSSIPLCEEKTKLFLKSSYTEDPSVPKKFFTPEFGALWTKACNPPEGETIYWGADPILETQDMEPEFLGIGPGEIDDLTIKVPVGFQHQGAAPYRKTFVFEQRNGRWLIADILTTGLRSGQESEFRQLQKDLGE